MPNKDRLLLTLRTLQQYSDEDHWVNTAFLRGVLQKEGHECSIRTLRRDIRAIRQCGWEVAVREKDGLPTEYAFVSRELEKPELQILVDAVSAAQFIPEKRSRELIRRLSEMAGPSGTDDLTPRFLISERVKAKNPNMIYTVQAIRQAIARERKIRFRYLSYTPDKEQAPRHQGTPEEQYVVSPYATVWNDDRYYLVGWSDKRQKVAVFRIDRMEVPRQMPNKRVPPPEDFDVRDYTDKVFRMYGGAEEQVTLKCSLEILDQVIDRFGDRITLRDVRIDRRQNEESDPHPGGTFSVTVPVSLSTTFYAWVFQYVGKMVIQSPEYVRETYAAFLQEAIDETLGDLPKE